MAGIHKIVDLLKTANDEGFFAAVIKIFKKIIYISKIDRALYKITVKLNGKYNSNYVCKPYQKIYVPTSSINYVLINKGKELTRSKFLTRDLVKIGTINQGDWDLNKIKIFENNVLKHDRITFKDITNDAIIKFRALDQRFNENKSWKKTLYYDAFINKKTTESFKYSKWKEFRENYLERFDQLYLEIKNNGYKSQFELEGKKSLFEKPEEVEVCISRDGKIVKGGGGGNHRLMLAKILNISQIPVVVNVWHEKYIKSILKELNLSINEITPKKAIQPLLDQGIYEA